MQDQYAGDIGDFVKLALLRALMPERRLSVAWFKTEPDERSLTRQKDGKFVGYLSGNDAAELQLLNPELFDGLKSMIDSNERAISGLEPLLAGQPVFLREHPWPPPSPPAIFYSKVLGPQVCRSIWYVGLTQFALNADLFFLDPDNGIAISSQPSPKHVALAEIEHLLGYAKTLIVYHHLSRIDTHPNQIEQLGKLLAGLLDYQAICAIWSRRSSPRVFFIIAPDQQIWNRAKAFAGNWQKHVSFVPLSEPPDGLGLTPGATAYHREEARPRMTRDQIDQILKRKPQTPPEGSTE